MRRGPVDSGYVGELFPSDLAVAPMYYPTSVGKPIMLCRLCKRICYNGDSRYLTCLKTPFGPHLVRKSANEFEPRRCLMSECNGWRWYHFEVLQGIHNWVMT